MEDLIGTGGGIIAGLLALLGAVGVAWWKGRGSGRASVPRPEQVRAETRQEVYEERRAERKAEVQEDLARIRKDTEEAVQTGKASREDADRLLREAEEWSD